MNYNYQKQKGFTLVEIMVATSIFMMIMLMAMGALITTSDTAKKAQALRTAMDNVNFAMESMTRSLRMGTDYYCIPAGVSVSLPMATGSYNDCPLGTVGGGAVVYTPALSNTPRNMAYTLVPRNDSSGTSVLQSCDPNECLDLVSGNIDIQKLTFFVNGSTLDDKIQPSIYIIMKGAINIKGEITTFALQTMTSQRNAE